MTKIKFPRYSPPKTRALRERLKLTRDDLARYLDVDPKHIYLLEKTGYKINRRISLALWMIERLNDKRVAKIIMTSFEPKDVQALRERLNWTRADLARALKVGKRQIYRFENKNYKITQRLALALRAIEMLAGEKDER